MQEVKHSVLTLEQQEKLTLTGVSSVDSFSDSAISLTVNGKRLLIGGSRLKVLAFSEGSGNFAASGEIVSIKFGGAKGSALKRLFR